MRPPKQGLFSFSHHVFVRNDIYYYRADIPSDLKHLFILSEIKQSLKTKDSKIAKVMAISKEYKLQQTFCLIRSGMLPDDVVQGLVVELQPSKAPKTRGKLLSGLVDDYIETNESCWTYKTKMEVIGCLKLIVDLIGDLEVKAINKQTVHDFKGKLMKLPANMYKCYPNKTIQEILMLPDVEPMSVNSVNKHIMRLNALLAYAVMEGILTVNYAQGMMLSDKRRTEELRKVYSVDNLQAIIQKLPREQGRPERFWIPLISMYTGMRLDEICQFYVEDVQQVDDVWCFSVNDDQDKKLKTLSSKRVIPIHPTLLRSGFMKYVEGLRSDEVPRLWMNLNWRKADGYSNAFDKWFQRFNREYVTNDKAKVFHSLRHNVADTLKQAGVQEVVISEIMGHENDSMTMSRYGKRYQPKILLDALLQLDYGFEVELK